VCGKFTSGFSRVTLLTAGEKTGLVFALNLALVGTPRGAALYTKAIARIHEKYEQIHNSDGTLKYRDKHFFADLGGASKGGKMDRTLEGVKRLVHAMRRHEVLSLMGSIE
jgi:hypothetical protein